MKTGDRPPCSTLASWAVQDSPPGAATAALVARGEDVPVGWLDRAIEAREVVALYNPRTATAVVPAGEAAAYATAFLPPDDRALKAIAGSAVPDRDEGFAEPVALAVDAVGDALDGRVLSRDDLHEELRRRLPGALLPWCPGCKSHHARRGLLVMAGLHGRLCLAGRAGRQPAFARTDQWAGFDPPPREEAAAELVRRFRRAYGPSTRQQFAQWAGLAPQHARALWELTGAETGAPALLPREGVVLLAPGDPLLLTRDREALLPDPALRKRLWGPIPTTGLVLSGGAPVALWRARKAGRRLDVALEAFADVDRDAVRAAADRLAPHRGCTSARVTDR